MPSLLPLPPEWQTNQNHPARDPLRAARTAGARVPPRRTGPGSAPGGALGYFQPVMSRITPAPLMLCCTLT
jgi:hypothetical protein